MKLTRTLTALSLIAVLALGATGCKRTPKDITPISGRKPGAIQNPDPNAQIKDGNVLPTGTETGPIPTSLGGPFNPDNFNQDRTIFASDTVYFDFDRHSVRKGEQAKVENVAGYLKGNPSDQILIEGHCDERGTEEYNRSLGEKRALAVREYLVRLGIDPERVHTLSLGEDRPAVPESNDAAWTKNRRGEFVLLRPKQ
jgi:peptidoglycan-associated lipoprotein